MSHRFVVARTSRRVFAGVVVLVGAAAATLFVAAPAAADPTGRIMVSVSSPTNLDDRKQVYAGCPAGMAALGGGAVIVGGDGIPHLTANVPTPVSNGHTAVAEEHGSATTAWRLTAHVICAYGVTGREVVLNGETIPAGAGTGAVYLDCPAGKQVIAMGGYVSPGFILSSVSVAANLASVTQTWGRPIDVSDSVTAWAEPWAVCVDPVPGLQRVSLASASNSNEVKAPLVTCPAGTELFDVGGGVYTGSRRHVKNESFVPATTNAAVIVKEMPYGNTGNWQAFAQAICAP